MGEYKQEQAHKRLLYTGAALILTSLTIILIHL